MIASDTLKTLAHKLQTTELNIRREYIQHIYLSYFYRNPAAKNIFFKGGTALRIVHNSPRFSEDLDFSSPSTGIKRIEDSMLTTLNEISREGIVSEVQESKLTSGGYLAVIEFSLAENSVGVRLEIYFRDRAKKGELTLLANDFIPPYPAMILNQEQLVAEKIQALLSRQKPRDFFDLYFMLRARLLTPHEKAVLPEVLKVLKRPPINFTLELKQFLPKTYWPVIRNFETVLAQEIERPM